MKTRRRQVSDRKAYNRLRRSHLCADWKPVRWDVMQEQVRTRRARSYDVEHIVIHVGNVLLEGYVEDVEISVGFTL